MNPEGSTRRTRASSGWPPPHCSIEHGGAAARRGRHRSTAGRRRSRALRDRRSRAAARRPAPPTRSRAAASARRRRPARRHRPSVRPSSTALQPGARELELVLGPRHGELRGAHALPRRVFSRRLRRFELVAARWRPASAAPPAGASVDCARVERRRGALALGLRLPDGRARRLDGGSQLRLAFADRSAALRPASGARPRSCRARPGSPGSSSMRCSRPATGADTTKRSRTRVSPSSSIVTCIGPRSTLRHVHLDRTRATARRPGWQPRRSRDEHRR